jgi:hypothetical protein
MTFIIWIIFAVLTALIANNKKRNVAGWLVLGFLFGLISLVIVAVLPSLEEKK